MASNADGRAQIQTGTRVAIPANPKHGWPEERGTFVRTTEDGRPGIGIVRVDPEYLDDAEDTGEREVRMCDLRLEHDRAAADDLTNGSGTAPAEPKSGTKAAPFTTSIAERLKTLFAGNAHAHGTHGAPEREADGLKWAIKRTAHTVREPVTLKVWEQHLRGDRPLGIIPIRKDSTCSWGCIDVDVYDRSLLDIVDQVERRKLPLVSCRSKSGGLHLFLFTREPQPAAAVQAALSGMAAVLRLDDSEIFPKQAQHKEGGTGNWMVMPYFGNTYDGKLREQVGIRHTGAEMDPEEFLRLAEERRLTSEQLAELIRAKKDRAKGNARGYGTHRSTADDVARAERYLAEYCAEIAAAQPGSRRNNLITKRTLQIGNMVGGGLLDRDRAAEQLITAGVACGRTPAELHEMVPRLLTEGARRPIYDLPIRRGEDALSTYEVRDGAICMMKRFRGVFVPVRLCNFTAEIVKDIKRDDGSGCAERRFVVEGSFGRAEVPAERFDNMAWVARDFGGRAVMTPGPHHREHLAAAIKTLSQIVEHTVYTHLGWRKIGDRLVYLHAGGAIGAEGPLEGVEVDPGAALAEFELPSPPRDLKAAVLASLGILKVAPPTIAIPLFAAIYRAPLGEFAPATLSVFLSGTTGVYKTELAKLVQAHFGPSRPPANWGSTPNSLERIAYLAKDAVLVVDDFAPRGTTHDVARLHAAAERLLRGQANRAGRHRMNADATLRPEMYPRGLIVATGEDVPSGHSLRARMVVVEVGAGDVDVAALTAMQATAEAGALAEALAGYVSWLARQKNSFAARERNLRAEARGPHARTPENVAALMLGVETAFRFATDVGAIEPAEAARLKSEAWSTLLGLAEAQAAFLRTESPIERFVSLITAVVSSCRGHIASVDADEPTSAESLGWREVARDREGAPILRGQGRCIGWIKGNDLYLEPNAAYAEAQELARVQHATIPVAQQTLWKRLDEQGLLKSKDPGRHTTKKQVAGTRMRVIHLDAGTLFENADVATTTCKVEKELPF
jgi:hypothetical protein